jgi:hypothetical protein
MLTWVGTFFYERSNGEELVGRLQIGGEAQRSQTAISGHRLSPE